MVGIRPKSHSGRGPEMLLRSPKPCPLPEKNCKAPVKLVTRGFNHYPIFANDLGSLGLMQPNPVAVGVRKPRNKADRRFEGVGGLDAFRLESRFGSRHVGNF
jgi:hypothetical protein